MKPDATLQTPTESVGATATADLKKAQLQADPFRTLIPGRIVYFYEQVMNQGIVICPAVVVQVHRNPAGEKTGEVRLHVFYYDGADGTKPSVPYSTEPAADRWSWPDRGE